MSIIDTGLDTRMLELIDLASEETAVQHSEDLYDKYASELTLEVGEGNTALRYLLDAVAQLRYSMLETGYRIGLADGLEMQQQINKLISVRG